MLTHMLTVCSSRGVIYDTETKKFEAVLAHNDNEISGGMYDKAEEAAKAYDALARMYKGADAEVNFPVCVSFINELIVCSLCKHWEILQDSDTSSSWIPPEREMRPVRIPVRKG